MKKIAIIGGGIIGMTLANYIDQKKYHVTLFDDPTGQATSASAGIISPWLSKRRNKQWYRLAKDGTGFFPKLIQDFQLDDTIYRQSGTLLLRPEKQLAELLALAEERKKNAPEIGTIKQLSAEQTQQELPLLRPHPALKVSGGGRLDGKAYLIQMHKLAEKKGVDFISQRAQLADTTTVIYGEKREVFDQIILTVGPHLKKLLAPLNYQVDLRPQKGQLLVFQTAFKNSGDFPVAMLDGEADLIPFSAGKILLGATHENEAGWNLKETPEAFKQLANSTRKFLAEPEKLLEQPFHYRVGTRAYTSDFAPFFGQLNDHLLVASGLGSSGLTTGPYIGYLLADYLNTGNANWQEYQKELSNYIQFEKTLASN
ncbi:NAD(P)/FAD-dependent oxidoreductase [Enterococcus xiangfangensis]|uniref:NAD(P)/FAD-dependent oxidoreductase n=1 Tax=Enterococcus xiangfangensis TaxID=1296537 RepID=UPI0010F83417|nr:FAD-dependent oxidoreductase [Enterococcus xiangfangensis]MBM7710907.1 glycine/D-amino acid oxidase-like deaminating enzyme [Enterococcus xiangfangensis]NBK07892.1 FAD-binding oxidoreductase [Enterococcus asini]